MPAIGSRDDLLVTSPSGQGTLISLLKGWLSLLSGRPSVKGVGFSFAFTLTVTNDTGPMHLAVACGAGAARGAVRRQAHLLAARGAAAHRIQRLHPPAGPLQRRHVRSERPPGRALSLRFLPADLPVPGAREHMAACGARGHGEGARRCDPPAERRHGAGAPVYQ